MNDLCELHVSTSIIVFCIVFIIIKLLFILFFIFYNKGDGQRVD